MVNIPHTVLSFDKQKKAFVSFVENRGGEILALTNEYEVLRFRGEAGVAIIYRNKQCCLSWSKLALIAWEAFKEGASWRGAQKTPRLSYRQKKRLNLVARLSERDGAKCIFCQKNLTTDTATIEHFLPLSSGGKHHLSNLGLACVECNRAVGHRPLAWKIKFAVEKQK